MDSISYQLIIRVTKTLTLEVGRLGCFTFPSGTYVYTGSARRNLEARINRHLSDDKKARWHIDYLLLDPATGVIEVRRSSRAECIWNQSAEGQIIVPGFGASDCRQGCGSHLKKIS